MPAKGLPILPISVDDYLLDTSRLSTEEHGAYLLLIMDYWLNGPPPDSDERLAMVTKCSAERWTEIRKALAPLFQIKKKRWMHKRVEIELAKAKRKANQRSAAGRASGAARNKTPDPERIWKSKADKVRHGMAIDIGDARECIRMGLITDTQAAAAIPGWKARP